MIASQCTGSKTHQHPERDTLYTLVKNAKFCPIISKHPMESNRGIMDQITAGNCHSQEQRKMHYFKLQKSKEK